MDLAYIAHSERCALLLDAEGVCRWVIPKVDAADAMVAAAKRCIGAQFVATLDRDTPGYMGHEPNIGANLLFALVTDGRVALVRFGPLRAFEELDPPSAMAIEQADAVVQRPRDGEEPTADAPASADMEIAEEEPLPPTVAAAIDVDDLITLLAEDASPSHEATEPSSDAVAEAAPAAAEATLPQVHEAEKPAAAEAADRRPEEETSAVDATSSALEIEPIALDPNGDVEIVTGSFARVSVTAVGADDSKPSDLDALDALISTKSESPLSQVSAASVDRSLERIVQLTKVSPDRTGNPDDSQLDVITAAFARPEDLAALLQSDDITLDTGSFALASSHDLESDGFMADTERVPQRPSGFVVKRAAASAGDEDTIAPDAETRRFSRVAGDMPFLELDSESRRGMLPRR